MRVAKKRKDRRKVKAILRHGPNARPVHKQRSGRTGSIRKKQLQPAKHGKPVNGGRKESDDH